MEFCACFRCVIYSVQNWLIWSLELSGLNYVRNIGCCLQAVNYKRICRVYCRAFSYYSSSSSSESSQPPPFAFRIIRASLLVIRVINATLFVFRLVFIFIEPLGSSHHWNCCLWARSISLTKGLSICGPVSCVFTLLHLSQFGKRVRCDKRLRAGIWLHYMRMSRMYWEKGKKLPSSSRGFRKVHTEATTPRRAHPPMGCARGENLSMSWCLYVLTRSGA